MSGPGQENTADVLLIEDDPADALMVRESLGRDSTDIVVTLNNAWQGSLRAPRYAGGGASSRRL